MPDPTGCKRLQNTDPATDIRDDQAAATWQPWTSTSTWIAHSREPTGAATSAAAMQSLPALCASWTAQQWALSGCTWPRIDSNPVPSINVMCRGSILGKWRRTRFTSSAESIDRPRSCTVLPGIGLRRQFNLTFRAGWLRPGSLVGSGQASGTS